METTFVLERHGLYRGEPWEGVIDATLTAVRHKEQKHATKNKARARATLDALYITGHLPRTLTVRDTRASFQRGQHARIEFS
jgi:hypothetical protein